MIIRILIALGAGALTMVVLIAGVMSRMTPVQKDSIRGYVVPLSVAVAIATWLIIRPRRAASVAVPEVPGGLRVHLGATYILFMIVFGVATFGAMAICYWYIARRWPAYLDSQGMTLRNGQRILWTEVTAVRQVTTRLYGAAPIARRWEIQSKEKTAVLVPISLAEGKAVLEWVSRAVGQNLLAP